MVEKGEFRSDLFFRLNSFLIELSPLRDLVEDIDEMVLHHAHRICDSLGIEMKGFSPEFFKVLTAYDWPGNIRELVNTMEEALVVARHEPTLYPCHLPVHIRVKMVQTSLKVCEQARTQPSLSISRFNSTDCEEFPRFRDFVVEMESQYLHNLMQAVSGSRKEACRLSGLSRTHLYELLKKHGIA